MGIETPNVQKSPMKKKTILDCVGTVDNLFTDKMQFQCIDRFNQD